MQISHRLWVSPPILYRRPFLLSRCLGQALLSHGRRHPLICRLSVGAIERLDQPSNRCEGMLAKRESCRQERSGRQNALQVLLCSQRELGSQHHLALGRTQPLRTRLPDLLPDAQLHQTGGDIAAFDPEPLPEPDRRSFNGSQQVHCSHESSRQARRRVHVQIVPRLTNIKTFSP